MRNNRVAWAIGGGILAFLLLVALLISIVVTEVKKNNKSECIKTCAFINDVRDTGKYSDKSDGELSEYGFELCYTIKSGASGIVYALEDEKIIESAITNLCPDVVE